MSGTLIKALDPLSIISDGACQTLYDEVGSPKGSIMEDSVERIKEVYIKKVSTMAQITTVLQCDVQSRYQELLIMVFTFITTLLLSFIIQTYLQ